MVWGLQCVGCFRRQNWGASQACVLRRRVRTADCNVNCCKEYRAFEEASFVVASCLLLRQLRKLVCFILPMVMAINQGVLMVLPNNPFQLILWGNSVRVWNGKSFYTAASSGWRMARRRFGHICCFLLLPLGNNFQVGSLGHQLNEDYTQLEAASADISALSHEVIPSITSRCQCFITHQTTWLRSCIWNYFDWAI